jgi:SAM-dependent methyltransferase
MKIYPVIIMTFLCCCLTHCRNKNENNDSESMQPIDGYPLVDNIEMIRQIIESKCIDTIRLKKGEVIADIGAGNGSLEAMLSVFNDSLTFYIQDIDTSVCNQKAINEVVNFYQNVRGKPFSNKFIIVAGADRETNLPNDTFDKILMMWTYQYFKDPMAIMTDLRLKLKSDGLMYIVNPDVDIESGKELTLKHGWNASPIERQVSDIIDCGFELIRISRNNVSSERPYIMVFKKRLLQVDLFSK